MSTAHLLTCHTCGSVSNMKIRWWRSYYMYLYVKVFKLTIHQLNSRSSKKNHRKHSEHNISDMEVSEFRYWRSNFGSVTESGYLLNNAPSNSTLDINRLHVMFQRNEIVWMILFIEENSFVEAFELVDWVKQWSNLT